MNLNLKSTRESLMRSYSLLESIVQDENIDVVDLMLYPQDKLISRSISAIAEEIEENYNCEDPEEMIHFVNSIQYTTPPVLTTSLHSYK